MKETTLSQKVSRPGERRVELEMRITPERVREIFKGFEEGDGAAFFENVAEDVDWTVMGSHPLAGHYHSKKDFIAGTFAKLGRVLPQGAQLHVEHLIVKDDQSVVELRALATAKNGMRFDNRYCWIVDFQKGLLVGFVPTSTRRWLPDCSRRIRLMIQ